MQKANKQKQQQSCDTCSNTLQQRPSLQQQSAKSEQVDIVWPARHREDHLSPRGGAQGGGPGMPKLMNDCCDLPKCQQQFLRFSVWEARSDKLNAESIQLML